MQNTSGLVTNQVKERILFFSPAVQGRMERESNSNDFEVIQGLGQGAFGKVFKVRHKKTKQVYALKQISKKQIKQQKMISQIINEVKIMYGLEHPNIIKLFNHYEEEDYLYLVLECATGGQLWHKLNKTGRFDEKTVKQFMVEIMLAIEYLHTRNPPIIHRDIKPENILLDGNGHIKIADFGWSNINNHQRTTYCGTLDYLAPEMIMEVGHDEKIDLWSLGVLIYELLTGKAPFAPNANIKDAKEQQRALEDNILKVRINFPPDFPSIAKSLVQGLLQKDPAKRFSIKNMKEHPWISSCVQPNQTKEEVKVKVQDIKEVIKDEKAQFSKEEIAQVVNRQLNQNVDEEEEIIIIEDNDQKPQESDLSKNTVFILNKKIGELNKQLNDAQVLLQVKIDENKALQTQLNEKGQQSVNLGVDQRKIKLLEEEKVKLKRDFENIWEEMKNKEAEIMRLNSEVQKMSQQQKQIDKLKVDKQQLQEKIKKLQEELDSNQQQMIEMKSDQDTLNSSRIHRIPSNQSSFLNNGDDLLDLNTTFTEMKNKFQIAKEQIEEFDKAQRKIIQQEAEIISLNSQLNEFKELVKQEIAEQFEDQIEDLEKTHKEQIRQIEKDNQGKVDQMEKEKISLKEQIAALENYKIENEGLKVEVHQINSILVDLKTQTDVNRKLRQQNDQRLREQDVIILDLKEKEKMYRKK